MNPRGLGYRVPVPDLRDRSTERLGLKAATPIGHADNRWQIVDILDQGSLGSCVLNAIMQMVRADQVKRLPQSSPPLGSRLAGYYFARVTAGEEEQDGGCDPRTAMTALRKWGICPEVDWPYDEEKFADCPSSIALHNCYDQRAYDYYWIMSSGAQKVIDVELALDAGYLVFVGGPIDADYGKWKPGNEPLGPVTAPIGGHARVYWGYDGKRKHEVGSWGDDLGDHGSVDSGDDHIIETVTSLMVIRKAPVVPQ
jgi:hypothetical protein